MEVTVRHSYYNASGFICPGFRIVPTVASASLMSSLGLLLKYESSGFSVLLDALRADSFADQLLMQSPPDSQSDDDTCVRLSFTLTATNENFVNITDMPIDVNPTSTCFYLSNTTARQESDGTVRLNPHGVGRPLQLTGAQYCVDSGSRFVEFELLDISGITVIPPPYPPPLPPGAPPGPTYLDLSRLPEDKYTLKYSVSSPMLSGMDGPGPQEEREFLYMYSAPGSMFFLDLTMTQPADVVAGVYPVASLARDPEAVVTQVHYFIEFEARATVWRYYIVSTGEPLSDLQIVTVSPVQSPPIAFSGPIEVTLPNECQAFLFTSTSPVPLQEQSTYNFQLTGQAGSLDTGSVVLLKRLPVASDRQVIPGDSDFTAEAGEPRDRSLDLLRSPPHSPFHSPPLSECNYSDIYVYV